MPIKQEQINSVTSILSTQEILDASASYASHVKPWSLAYEGSPSLVLAPAICKNLQALVKFLYDSEPAIDFAVRGRGAGSSTAHDVVVSMRCFDDFSFDHAHQTVHIGAGLDWGDVDQKLAEMAPGYVVVGARCPFVGVAGSTLTGGFSWLSHEYGIGCDPHNLLDVQIVLNDGRLVWAGQESPELLWALRGGGSNFGIVVTLRMKAHKHPRATMTFDPLLNPTSGGIFSTLLHFPPESVNELSCAISNFASDSTYEDPKLAMHVFVLPGDAPGRAGLTADGKNTTEQDDAKRKPNAKISLLIFDAHGESHARSAKGFKWALEDITGVIEETHTTVNDQRDAKKEISLASVHELQRGGQSSHGTSYSWLSAALVGGENGPVDDMFLVRMWKWYLSLTQNDGGESGNMNLNKCAFVLLEIMQKASFTSSPSPNATAWPHGAKGRQHVLQLSVGTPDRPQSDSEFESLQSRAFQILQEAPAEISNKTKHSPEDYLPNFLVPGLHDVPAVFGVNNLAAENNWHRLRSVKRRYDAKGRFGRNMGSFFVHPLPV